MSRAITWQDFYDAFTGRRRAFHLEMRDEYHVEQEAEPFAKWLAGEPDDYAWRSEWLQFITDTMASGVMVQRVRVVSEPPTDYLRWAMSCDPGNLKAGEDVRYLPRQQLVGIALPPEDFWLFDDELLVLSLFEPDGSSGGFAIEADPNTIATYRAVRDLVWPRAIPFERYRPR